MHPSPADRGRRLESRFTRQGSVRFLGFAIGIGSALVWHEADALPETRLFGMMLSLHWAYTFARSTPSAPFRWMGIVIAGLLLFLHTFLGIAPNDSLLRPTVPLYFTGACVAAIPLFLLATTLGVSALRALFILVVLILGVTAGSSMRPEVFRVSLEGGGARYCSAVLAGGCGDGILLNPPRTAVALYYPDNPWGVCDTEPTNGPLDLRRLALFGTICQGLRKTSPLQADTPIRLEFDPQKVKEVPAPMEYVLYRHLIELYQGDRWELLLEARSDAPRPAILSINEISHPYNSIGLMENLSLRPQWQTFRFPLDITQTHGMARLNLWLGGSTSPVEVRRIEWRKVSGASRYPATRMIIDHLHNDEGFRSRQHPLVKPPHTFRIAVLGDSTTYGQGVPEGQDLPRQLEKSLLRKGRRGMNLDVMNFGMCGFDTAFERRCYEEFVRPYHPDLVLLVMFSNDHIPPAPLTRRPEDTLRLPAGLVQQLRGSVARDGFKRCMEELWLLRQTCEQDGSKFGVVLLDAENGPEFVELKALLAEVAPFVQAPVLDIYPAFSKFGLRKDHFVVSKIDHHFNGRTNEIFAGLIRDWLIDQQLVPKP
jgi:hypothetical protein